MVEAVVMAIGVVVNEVCGTNGSERCVGRIVVSVVMVAVLRLK